MKTIIVLCAVVWLAGCTTTMKVDNEIKATLKQMDKNMTLDCRAGLATGITSGSDVDTALKASLNALNLYANKESEDYKKCFADGAWVSFSVHGSGDVLSKMVKEIMSVGVVAP